MTTSAGASRSGFARPRGGSPRRCEPTRNADGRGRLRERPPGFRSRRIALGERVTRAFDRTVDLDGMPRCAVMGNGREAHVALLRRVGRATRHPARMDRRGKSSRTRARRAQRTSPRRASRPAPVRDAPRCARGSKPGAATTTSCVRTRRSEAGVRSALSSSDREPWPSTRAVGYACNYVFLPTSRSSRIRLDSPHQLGCRLTRLTSQNRTSTIAITVRLPLRRCAPSRSLVSAPASPVPARIAHQLLMRRSQLAACCFVAFDPILGDQTGHRRSFRSQFPAGHALAATPCEAGEKCGLGCGSSFVAQRRATKTVLGRCIPRVWTASMATEFKAGADGVRPLEGVRSVSERQFAPFIRFARRSVVVGAIGPAREQSLVFTSVSGAARPWICAS